MTDTPDFDPKVIWPIQPRYAELVGGEGLGAWVRYKSWSADWHINALEVVGLHSGHYDRLIGIEMALDGAFAALCGAFDAAVGGLLPAVENKLGLAEAAKVPQHKYSWPKCKELIDKLGANREDTLRDLSDEIEAALEGRTAEKPIGWLAVLQRLRNRAIHQNSLRRTHSLSAGGPRVVPDTTITIGDVGEDPVTYLRKAADQMHDLSHRILIETQQLGGDIGFGQAVHRSHWFEAENQRGISSRGPSSG